MILNDKTMLERLRMLNGGMIELSSQELDARLNALGYEIDVEDSFDYVNASNEITYRARSVAIRHKASGLSFAHIECDRTNLAALQSLRLNHFVFVERNGVGRIWEI